jgi:hypothetical protein
MLESKYQTEFLDKLRTIFAGCIILKNNASYLQGVPDWIILYCNKWATLEIKRTICAHKQPNQAHYVNRMNNMSYSAFVYPENEQQIILELIEHFKGETQT